MTNGIVLICENPIRNLLLNLVHKSDWATSSHLKYNCHTPKHTRAILNIKVHKHILIACFSYILPLLIFPLSRFAATHFSFLLYIYITFYTSHGTRRKFIFFFRIFINIYTWHESVLVVANVSLWMRHSFQVAFICNFSEAKSANWSHARDRFLMNVGFSTCIRNGFKWTFKRDFISSIIHVEASDKLINIMKNLFNIFSHSAWSHSVDKSISLFFRCIKAFCFCSVTYNFSNFKAKKSRKVRNWLQAT